MDAHVHLTKWWPNISTTGYRPELDYSLHGLLSEMDSTGIDRALVLQMYLAPEEEGLAEGQRLYDDSGGRLLPVATIDPTQGEESFASSLLRLEQEERLYGIKLYPGYRPFYPHDRRLDPVYELAHRRSLPVLFHQGDTLEGRGLLKFARPLEVDEVAGRFRDVPFVLCHLGNPWIDEAAELVYKNPNVHADMSGLLASPSSPYFQRSWELALQRVEEVVVSTGLPSRFLFGSDWPLESLEAAVGLTRRLDLSDTDRAALLGSNAERLFRLKR